VQLFPFLPLPPPPFAQPPMQAAPYEQTAPSIQTAPSEDEGTVHEMPARLRRQIVNYTTRESPGTIIIGTPNTYLYYVLGNGQAIRYGIGVGRDGFTWSGVQSVTRKAEWPDWTPPPEMIARQPYLPRHMAGGPGNPRDVSRRHGVSHSRHPCAGDDRHACLVGMHPSHQSGRHRPLFARQRRHQGDRAADGSPRGRWNFNSLEHDPEKHALGQRPDGWKPVFPRDKRGNAFARRSCSNKKMRS
jgi:hypothetical protein